MAPASGKVAFGRNTEEAVTLFKMFMNGELSIASEPNNVLDIFHH
jgi:hypothetical protein